MNESKQKIIFKIPKVFFLIAHYDGWFFRFFNGWGIAGEKRQYGESGLRFSERFGISNFIMTRKYIYRILK